MSNFQSEIQNLVQDFVTSLTEAWKRAVSDALIGVQGGSSPSGARGGRRGGGSSSAASTSSASSAASRRKGEKRTSDELDGLAERFQDFVQGNPGLRIEQINKQLGTTTKDLALPIRKLISEGQITAKGQKRSTTYFAGKKKGKN